MRTLSVVALFAAFALPATCQPVATAADLKFMTGCWAFEANGRKVEEHWLAPAGGSLLGMSRTVMGGKTTEYEFLQIRELPEGLTYIAKPSKQAEARFVASSRSGDEIVFENASHDFPQRIRYRGDGKTLRARIEGTMNGQARAFDFPYLRTACAP